MKNFTFGIFTLLVTGMFSACEPMYEQPNPNIQVPDNNVDTLDTLNIDTLVTLDTLKRGLLLYLPFNDSTKDESGNSNHAVNYYAEYSINRFGVENKAYHFNGDSSYMVIKDNLALRLNNTDFTLNMWVNLDDYYPLSGSSLLSKNTGSGQQGWNCSIVGYGHRTALTGRAYYNVSGGDDPSAAGYNMIGLHNWNMLTITYDLNAQQIKFYVNGEYDQTVSNMPTPNPSIAANLHIGNNSFNDTTGLTPTYFIKGSLDDIRIYNRKIKQKEIKKLFTIVE